jgi:hypothetical protein
LTLCESDESLDALVNRAGEALDEAQNGGENRVCVRP